jgi:hypothetical protein
MESMPSPILTSHFNQRARRHWNRGVFSPRGMSGLLFACRILEGWLACTIKLCSGELERKRMMQNPVRGECNASRKKVEVSWNDSETFIRLFQIFYTQMCLIVKFEAHLSTTPSSSYFARLNWIGPMRRARNGKS